MKKNKVVLIDGHALIHRAFHALPDLKTKEGQLVNAVYGFSLILLNSLKELKPDYVAVSFDLSKPTFRHRQDKEYKAKRAKASPELYKQIPMIKKVVKKMNIPIFEARGYEADDVIGTLAKKISQEDKNNEITIVTGDLDLLQLVNDQVRVYTMHRGLTNMMIYGLKEVNQRYGFGPELLIDYKGLVGDSSDNIKGIRGIGAKTAEKLIDQFGDMDSIYQALKKGQVDFPDRTIKLLKEGREDAEKSKDLATIRTNTPIEVDLEKMVIADYDREKVAKLFSELEFKSLLEKLPQANSQKEKPIGKKKNQEYLLVETKKDWQKLKKELGKQKQIAVDIETKTLEGEIIGISFSYQKDKASYVSLLKEVELEDLKSILEAEKIAKIGHGMKYDYRKLKEAGIQLKPLWFDTMISAHLLDPEKRNYKLDRLVFSELGQEMIPLESLMGKDYSTTLDKVDINQVKDYSCEDADLTYQLFEIYQPELKKKKLWSLCQKIEMPLIEALADMEQRGIKIDEPYLEKLKDKTSSQLKEIKKQIYKTAGHEFNINSTQQLREVLFDKLNISTQGVRKTKTGFSTAAPELKKIQSRHPVVYLIIQHRQLEKMRNTYLEPLLEKTDQRDRLHTNFNQVITATGRLSSSGPNLQNIPTRTALGQEIRSAFISQPNYVLASFDYSQVELRVAAHLSQDKNMIKAFENDQDIHASTAALINQIPLKEITPQQRREAKTINFGVLYGMSDYGLSQAIDKPREYAKKFIENYYQSYPQLKEFLEKTKKEASQNGYTETLFGRRRYFDFKKSQLSKSQLERAAINSPIQGTAADIIKKAMIEIQDQLPDQRLLLQVHDELVFEIPEKDVKNVATRIKKIMEGVVELSVPLKVDQKTGQRWGDLKEFN